MSTTDARINTAIPIDKIVRIFTGSFNASTDTITRNYTLSGAPNAVKMYRIPHGLTRPVACELLWSINGDIDEGIFYDGGMWDLSNRSAIAFSDSTYIYIIPPTTSSLVVPYKVYCSWIDDYDATNPTVQTRTYSDVPQLFDSRVNYQKIKDYGVVTFTAGTAGSQQTISLAHGLTYTPNVKVFFEAFTGEVWPLNAGGATNLFNIDDSQEECQLAIDTDSVDITMTRFSNIARGAWYKIYYDAA